MDKIWRTLVEMQKGIDNLSLSLLLGILGIAITIFTVVYSFMESTKERKRLLYDRINADANIREVDPVLRADFKFAAKHLTDLWITNKSIIAIIIADIVIVAIYIVHMTFKDSVWLWLIALGSESLLIIVCLITLYVYLKQYYKRFINVV